MACYVSHVLTIVAAGTFSPPATDSTRIARMTAAAPDFLFRSANGRAAPPAARGATAEVVAVVTQVRPEAVHARA